MVLEEEKETRDLVPAALCATRDATPVTIIPGFALTKTSVYLARSSRQPQIRSLLWKEIKAVKPW